MPITPSTILALDVGEKRVGVATASLVARLPMPLTTLERGADFWQRLEAVIASESAAKIVVGYPRGLEGQTTQQTEITQLFVDELLTHTELPVVLQDESLTSSKAEAELAARGKPFAKGDVDALAATYILEDYLTEHDEVR